MPICYLWNQPLLEISIGVKSTKSIFILFNVFCKKNDLHFLTEGQERKAILKRSICCAVRLETAVNRTFKQNLCSQSQERSHQRMIK